LQEDHGVNSRPASGPPASGCCLDRLDPQAWLLGLYGIDTSSLQRTIYDVLVNRLAISRKVIMKTVFGATWHRRISTWHGIRVELRQALAQERVLEAPAEPGRYVRLHHHRQPAELGS